MTKVLYRLVTHNLEYQVFDSRPNLHFFELNQIHGNRIVTAPLSKKEDADGIEQSNNITTPSAIKTADCLPIILVSEKSFAILHAGWKGLAERIVDKTKMNKRSIHTAIIGPHIRKCCFEVSQEFKKNFQHNNFHIHKDKLYFDLTQEAIDQLRKMNPKIKVIDSKICTKCNKIFHSFRRDKTDKRNYNIIKYIGR